MIFLIAYPLLQAAPELPGWMGYLLGPFGVLVGLVIVVRAYDSGRIVRREDVVRQLAERDGRIEGLEAAVKDERDRGERREAAERERTDRAVAALQELQALSREAVGHAERVTEASNARRPSR